MILAGISLNAIVGDNGIITRARKAGEAMERAAAQEELELIIVDLQTEKLEKGEELTARDIKEALENRLSGITVKETVGNHLYGEYKNFSFIINDKEVTLNDKKLSGEAPILQFVNLNEYGDSSLKDEVELKVVGEIKGGTIEKIEVIETKNVEFMEGDSRNSEYGINSVTRMYKISDNGIYHFMVTSSNGRMYAESVTINNATPLRKDLLTGIEEIKESGYKRIRVKGKTTEYKKEDEIEETEVYTLKVIYSDEDLILKNGLYTKGENGAEVAKTSISGLTLSGTTWSVGETADVNTNTVVLKVDGDLTLNSGYTLTSVKSGTAYTKGLFIYCTGTLTINGTVNMNGVTSTAEKSNVYLWKNSDGVFEYIRKDGGTPGTSAGAAGIGFGYSVTTTSSNGTSVTYKDSHWITGGGGSAKVNVGYSTYGTNYCNNGRKVIYLVSDGNGRSCT